MKEGFLIIVSEFDCIECVDKIKTFIDSFQQSTETQFFGLLYKGSSQTRLEPELTNNLLIQWNKTDNIAIFNDLYKLTNSLSGPYVVKIQKGEPLLYFIL